MTSEIEFLKDVLGDQVEIPAELKVGKGCASCNGTGYFDRIVVVEVWRATLEMKRALIEGGDMEAMLKAARADGYQSLLEFGLRMALSGLTTVEEVRRYLSVV